MTNRQYCAVAFFFLLLKGDNAASMSIQGCFDLPLLVP
jgi:hypothetical protein